MVIIRYVAIECDSIELCGYDSEGLSFLFVPVSVMITIGVDVIGKSL